MVETLNTSVFIKQIKKSGRAQFQNFKCSHGFKLSQNSNIFGKEHVWSPKQNEIGYFFMFELNITVSVLKVTPADKYL